MQILQKKQHVNILVIDNIDVVKIQENIKTEGRALIQLMATATCLDVPHIDYNIVDGDYVCPTFNA